MAQTERVRYWVARYNWALTVAKHHGASPRGADRVAARYANRRTEERFDQGCGGPCELGCGEQ